MRGRSFPTPRPVGAGADAFSASSPSAGVVQGVEGGQHYYQNQFRDRLRRHKRRRTLLLRCMLAVFVASFVGVLVRSQTADGVDDGGLMMAATSGDVVLAQSAETVKSTALDASASSSSPDTRKYQLPERGLLKYDRKKGSPSDSARSTATALASSAKSTMIKTAASNATVSRNDTKANSIDGPTRKEQSSLLSASTAFSYHPLERLYTCNTGTEKVILPRNSPSFLVVSLSQSSNSRVGSTPRLERRLSHALVPLSLLLIILS